ncbi:MAG: TIGR02452 family protein [Chloroflexi bacterium]|nr:TIGR02452 family protein [Chloroflexota bacterium]
MLSFSTSAAPYAPAIGQPESGDLFAQRIRRVLAIARACGYAALVVGAWGCGAYGNDVNRSALDSRHALERELDGAFTHVVFAISDWRPQRGALGAFCRVFASGGE